MEYLSIKETANKWGLTARRVQVLCSGKRIPGAFRIGNMWAIPADAQKPKDARIRTGKYIKEEKNSL
ncbi:MAG: DNA-binding protein [Bacillus sp. (in: firmicutes)]